MKISEINIYPVKALKRTSLQRAVAEERGFAGDRRFMLVDQNGDLVTQRQIPALATSSALLHENTLEVLAEGAQSITIGSDFDESANIKVRVWDSVCDALLADDLINKWFSETFGSDLRLVKMPDSTRRRVNEKFNAGDDIVSFADGYPILVICEASLADLNSRLDEKIPMDRFRPNIVVSGGEAYEEDSWRRIKIGGAVFRGVKPCARCVVTTVDQKTGVFRGKEPLKTLATYRKPADLYPISSEEMGFGKNDVLFGMYLVADNFGEAISVGDDVEILKRG
ncbi:MAG: MOSC domain-containing protein [Pyrinomonadaceae bacterium]|nr:MOSC domain-containing protein [Pyrinomonadaceae bacterium]